MLHAALLKAQIGFQTAGLSMKPRCLLRPLCSAMNLNVQLRLSCMSFETWLMCTFGPNVDVKVEARSDEWLALLEM